MFTSQPSDVTIIEKRSLVLPCSASGFPTPTITWYRDGTIVTRHTQLTSGALSIYSVETTDEGEYDCVVVSITGYEIRSSMTLTVQGVLCVFVGRFVVQQMFCISYLLLKLC